MGFSPVTYAAAKKVAEDALTGAGAIKGQKGDPGANGKDGANGKSAYEIAVADGFTGTEKEWLASLVGPKGDTGATGEAGPKGQTGSTGEKGATGATGRSAYEIAVANGFTGTEAEWIGSLKGKQGEKGETGKDGADGKSFTIQAQFATEADLKAAHPTGNAGDAYYVGENTASSRPDVYIWLEEQGEWYNQGPISGVKGDDGEPGKTAYELAKDNGYSGSESEWLASLKGQNGTDGTNGKSAYELAKDGGYTGTEEEWVESLKGTDGAAGQNGKSAYEVAKDNGFTGTQEEWLASLKGSKGDKGEKGDMPTVKTTVENPSGKKFLLTGDEGIDYDKLAKTIIESYNSSTLAGAAQSPQAAINGLNASLTPYSRIRKRAKKELSSAEIAAVKYLITNGTLPAPFDIIDGDYFYGASKMKYTLAHYNYFKGSATQYAVLNYNHYCLVVDTMSGYSVKWAENDTTPYMTSTIRSYLVGTALPKIKSDMAALGFSVESHQCLEGNAATAAGTTSWIWKAGEEICALSETQVYGSTIAASSFLDEGEANRQLDCFRNFSFMDICDMKYFWLKERSSQASCACYAGGHYGDATGDGGVGTACAAFGLIIVT